MKKTSIITSCKRYLADVYTPVGIYLRLRDRFRDTVLLESTDFHTTDNSFSFIGINAIGGIEITNEDQFETKFPGKPPMRQTLNKTDGFSGLVDTFMQGFEANEPDTKEGKYAQGLFGYMAYDTVGFLENIAVKKSTDQRLAALRYRLYQYVIVFNHFKDEMFICENKIDGIESELQIVESLILGKDIPVYPFAIKGAETTNMPDEDYLSMVQKGIASCKRGDVFQIVLSRSYQQKFSGDDFNVYRALRSINPSPYLFYFDYGDYKLMGSSPEAQVMGINGEAVVHPIAGTFKRTGNDEADLQLSNELLRDEKENAEHVMLVDLARNDLSRICNDVQVKKYKEVQYFSHVIHLVSEVTGNIKEGISPFTLLATTFPAGTLSGAPKVKAMQLINEYEPTTRGFYGGAIGFLGLDGTCNHAIMIRTMLSRDNTLHYQAGAGVVAASVPEKEMEEVNNKLRALKKAIELAIALNPK